MNKPKLRFSLFAAICCSVVLFSGVAFSQDNMWRIYLLEAEQQIHQGKFDEAKVGVDKALDHLKDGVDNKALAEAYYMKAALVLFSGTDVNLATEYIVSAIKAAPKEPMPDKDYLSDPRIREYKDNATQAIAEQVDEVIGYSRTLLEGKKYCQAKMALERVRPYCTTNRILADTMYDIASSECRSDPLNKVEDSGGRDEGRAEKSTLVGLQGNARVGVLPIYYCGVARSNVKEGSNANWLNTLKKVFSGYAVELAGNLNPEQLKSEFGLESYKDFLVRKWQVKVSGNLFDLARGDDDKNGVALGALPRSLAGAMRKIMESGKYEYVVVASITPRSGNSVYTFFTNIYHCGQLSDPLVSDTEKTSVGRPFSYYFTKAAKELRAGL